MKIIERLSLDVGCGSNPKGTVNVDFFKEGYNIQTGDQKKGKFVDPHEIENFVVADALYLPFKAEVFNVVFSNHVIEHVPNPKGMLLELNRVCKNKIIVRCPHRKGSGAIRPFHVNYLDENWFKTVALNAGLSVGISIVHESPIMRLLFKVLPHRIWIVLRRLIK